MEDVFSGENPAGAASATEGRIGDDELIVRSNAENSDVVTAATKDTVAFVGEGCAANIVQFGAVSAGGVAAGAFFGDRATYYDRHIISEGLLDESEFFGDVSNGFGVINVVEKGGTDF